MCGTSGCVSKGMGVCRMRVCLRACDSCVRLSLFRVRLDEKRRVDEETWRMDQVDGTCERARRVTRRLDASQNNATPLFAPAPAQGRRRPPERGGIIRRRQRNADFFFLWPPTHVTETFGGGLHGSCLS